MIWRMALSIVTLSMTMELFIDNVTMDNANVGSKASCMRQLLCSTIVCNWTVFMRSCHCICRNAAAVLLQFRGHYCVDGGVMAFIPSVPEAEYTVKVRNVLHHFFKCLMFYIVLVHCYKMLMCPIPAHRPCVYPQRA